MFSHTLLQKLLHPTKFGQPALLALVFLLAQFLILSPTAVAQANPAIEIGNGTVDSERVIGQRWVRVEFDAQISGTHTISVNWGGNAIVRFSLFQIVNGNNTLVARADETTSPLEWTGVLSNSEQYYLGVWAVSGSANFTATLEAVTQPTGPEVELGQGTLDSESQAAPSYQRMNFSSQVTANHTVRVSWNGNADLRFRVLEADGTPISAVIEGSNPGVWSGQLLANKNYYVGIWSENGVANYRATIEAQTSDGCGFPQTPPQLTQQPNITLNQVMDYGIADTAKVLGQRHNVIRFSPKESGPTTIALRWKGPETMFLSVFDTATNQRLASANDICSKANSSLKSITLNLDANKQYHANAYVESGSAEWVMRRIQTVENPNFGISDAPDSAQRPNIVLINTDDQRTRTLEFLPAIQELLVKKGVSYPNTIVPTPSCCPSRATTLSGQYVHNNKQFQQQRVNTQIFEKTFQKYLKQAGYFTGHAGKYLHWVEKDDPIPPYWDRWTYITGGFYDVDMNFDGRAFKPGGYTTDIIFERTKDYLRDFEARNDNKPWFVYIAPTSPHRPYTAEYDFRNAAVPELDLQSLAYLEADISDKPSFFRFRSIDDARARDIHQQRARNLLSLDREVEQLVEYLDASGELDNTLIIFTSDNGYILGEHQTYGKFTPYRDSVQVPLVISWPGQVAQNVVNESFVSHVDIAPTILDAAGVDTSAITFDGRNLFDESRDTFYMEYFLDPEANGGRIGDWASLRTQTYQYTEWYSLDGSGEVVFREYYDMTNDPYQLENLYENSNVADDPDYANLSTQLLNARQCVGVDCP